MSEPALYADPAPHGRQHGAGVAVRMRV